MTRLRHFLSLLRSSEMFMGITLALVVGAIAGFGAVVFRWLIKTFQSSFFLGGADVLSFMGQYYVILLPAVGGLLVGLLVYFGAREVKGHAVPQVIESFAVGGGRIRSRVAGIQALASSICIGSGGSAGREGPIVQIGASAGSTIGQWLKLPEDWLRTLILCGAAGGISATFNAPIGGVFFALEVIQRRFVVRNLAPVVISSVVADVIALRFLGDSPAFNIFPYAVINYWEMVPYFVLGIVCGLAAVAFIFVLYRCEDIFNAWRIPDYLKPVFGGILVGFIGLYSYDLFGVGYGETCWVSRMSIDYALAGQIGLGALLIMAVLKMLATSATLGSGGSGGVFAPSLFIGAMLGGAFGTVVHQLYPAITASSGAYALVGMGALFAGTARAPITAIIILFEMTRDYTLILPLMIAVVMSTFIARSLNRESIYTLKLRRRGVDIRQHLRADIMRTIRVSEVMTRNFPTVSPEMPISKLSTKFAKTGHHGFPVVDEDGRLYGVVTLEDVENSASRDAAKLTVADIATKSPIVAYPDQNIHDVLAQFGGRDVGRIPVVDRQVPKKLLGVLRRHDIIGAYTSAAVGRNSNRKA